MAGNRGRHISALYYSRSCLACFNRWIRYSSLVNWFDCRFSLKLTHDDVDEYHYFDLSMKTVAWNLASSCIPFVDLQMRLQSLVWPTELDACLNDWRRQNMNIGNDTKYSLLHSPNVLVMHIAQSHTWWSLIWEWYDRVLFH